jgi:23S rRNA (cytidine1920-2'-O)/16S rRNA (cytidine1409-2'-O)-methyltransferase
VSGRRADVELFERGLFPSREQARAAILAGEVKADGAPVLKAGQSLSPDAAIEVAERPKYVSRGGHKIEGALVGASTGGFTDCVLKRGASSVVALDVGYGQLAWSLRTDPRVTVVERTNFKDADLEVLGAPFDLIVVDVSFIAFANVLPKVLEAAGENGQVIGLVKPQFEAGKGRVGKKGVVRDPVVHTDVLEGVCAAVERSGWVVKGLTWSPLKGPEGNIEFWVWLGALGEPASVTPVDIVSAAHRELGD